MSAMVKAFSYDVDFQRELRFGDGYEVVYEQYADEKGVSVKTGRIVYAALTLSGKALAIYGYTDQTGHQRFLQCAGRERAQGTAAHAHGRRPDHLGLRHAQASDPGLLADAQGHRFRRADRHADLRRRRRRHRHRRRPTRASAIMSDQAQRTYATAYGHISRFASGMKPGRRVKQGQVIGYVGQTGWRPARTLHFEVLINGTQINPQNIKLPTGEKLAGKRDSSSSS